MWRCRDAAGASCVVKESDVAVVSAAVLGTLVRLRCPNVAVPRRVWTRGGRVYEELPLVEGVPLRDAVPPGTGGLGGSVLAAFRAQLAPGLRRLHAAGLRHGDVHVGNVIAVLDPPAGWTGARFGRGQRAFRLAWVLVDCSGAGPAGPSPELDALETAAAVAATGRARDPGPVPGHRRPRHGYAGTLQLGPDAFLVCDAAAADTVLVDRASALALHRCLEVRAGEDRRHEHRTWVKRLMAPG